MRKPATWNIDELVNKLSHELDEYFGAVNYVVYFTAIPIPLNNKPANAEELLKPYITNKKDPSSSGLNERNYKRDGLKRINIQNAKAILKKQILLEEQILDSKKLKKGLERLDKLWQLISHYVSFSQSKIYYYDNFSEMGIFWSYTLLIVDDKSDYAFFLNAGAWD